MAGRNPNVVHNVKKERMTKEELETMEKRTPVYESQNFIAPPTLNKKELKIWNWLVDVFHQTTNCMVSDADVQLMELYCRAKAAADEAHFALEKDPRPYISVQSESTDKYLLKVNPNIKKEHDNALLCLKFFDQLGLSPLARARVGVKAANAKKEKSVWEDLTNRTDL